MPSPPPPDTSRLAQLLEKALGENLHDWIAAVRADFSWRETATLLRARTGVDITDTTLRTWYPDLTAAGQAEQESEGS